MDNAQTFIRGSHAPDGIHEEGPVYFNEYKSPKWWSERRLRRELIEKLAPYAIVVLTVAAFAIIGLLEGCL